MNCPVCESELRVVERGGIEIDTCPRCRGVWLDRGELDKLIEGAAGYYANRRGDDDSDYGDYGRGHPPPGYGHRPPQKKGFFGRMFDFD